VLSKGDFNQQSNEITFNCPFCKHTHKKKLNINLITEKWHCWVCGAGGHKVFGLFKRLRVEQRFFNILSKITGNSPSTVKYDKEYEVVLLPPEFKPLSESSIKNPEAKNALSYLIGRGLTVQDILKYNIGYCGSGKYNGMIIIPSYDEDGTLNFFTGRSYYNVRFKHLNPTVSKDIIGFDLFINWKLPITIVEGAFDAIAVKRNAIPLFGKQILDKLKIKILEKGVKRVNVVLDRDAMKNAISMADYFNSNGISVYFVELPEKDPSDLGFLEITRLIQGVEKLTPQKLLEYKINAY
jgi:DNA primase|tara:strand:+ start:649 stop:1536 length:888 start_codon:yes stop_codon:yes gene_type:complete